MVIREVLCNGKKEYDKLMAYLDKIGYIWNCGYEPKKRHLYRVLDDNTKIIINLHSNKTITFKQVEIDSVDGFIKNNPLSQNKKPNKDLIVIYRNGDKVVAKNKVTEKVGEANCHPDDRFDFSIGARLAFDRLMSDEEDEKIEDKEHYFSGKVVCLSNVIGFTKGKIYEFVNGKTVDDDQDIRPLYDRVRDINDIYNGAFVEIVE